MPRTPRGRRLLAVAVGLLMALVAIEAAMRILDVPSTRPFFQSFTSLEHRVRLECLDRDKSGATDIDLRDPQQRAGYERLFPDGELTEHWRATPFAAEVRLNTLGYRAREDMRRRPDISRIVAVGDSFTIGHAMPDRLSWPRLLETELRGSDAAPIEVLNCGVGGKNLDDLGPRMEGLLELLEPDVLVYGYFINDALPSETSSASWVAANEAAFAELVESGWPHAEQVGPRLTLGVREPPWSRLWAVVDRAVEARRLHRVTMALYRHQHEPDVWQPSGRMIERIDRRARERGCRFVLVLLPMIYDVGGGGDYPLAEAHAHIVDYARAHGIDVLDCLPALRGFTDDELSLHPNDLHPSPTYNRAVARTIAAHLR